MPGLVSPFHAALTGRSKGVSEERRISMSKSISEFMTANPCSIDADRPVAYAAKMMRDEDVGLAPIGEGGRLVGTLTDRDIVTRLVAEERDPGSTPVSEIASRDPVTVDSQQTLDDALRPKAQHQGRPVAGAGPGG